jgi:hypothetical protein
MSPAMPRPQAVESLVAVVVAAAVDFEAVDFEADEAAGAAALVSSRTGAGFSGSAWPGWDSSIQRTPLTSIRTSLEVGLAHPDRAPWTELAERAVTETSRLQHLVDALLLLAR